MRTTIDIDDPILREVKALQEREGKSLGRIVSDLLARGLRVRRAVRQDRKSLRWIARAMEARVDLADKDAVYASMERDARRSRGATRS